MKNENKEKIKKLNWLGFQKKERLERIQMLKENGFLSDEFEQILKKNENLPLETSNQMAENGIGTFALPFSIAPNFIVDGKDYAVPMVTEEPSVVAGCSYAAKIIGKSGGFTTEILNRKMIGQVALYEILDFDNAISMVLENKNKLLKDEIDELKQRDRFETIVAGLAEDAAGARREVERVEHSFQRLRSVLHKDLCQKEEIIRFVGAVESWKQEFERKDEPKPAKPKVDSSRDYSRDDGRRFKAPRHNF